MKRIIIFTLISILTATASVSANPTTSYKAPDHYVYSESEAEEQGSGKVDRYDGKLFIVDNTPGAVLYKSDDFSVKYNGFVMTDNTGILRLHSENTSGKDYKVKLSNIMVDTEDQSPSKAEDLFSAGKTEDKEIVLFTTENGEYETVRMDLTITDSEGNEIVKIPFEIEKSN